MLQPGKPYSSLPGAQYHGRKFNEAVGLARKEVRHMFLFGAQRWDFPHGWNNPAPASADRRRDVMNYPYPIPGTSSARRFSRRKLFSCWQ